MVCFFPFRHQKKNGHHKVAKYLLLSSELLDNLFVEHKLASYTEYNHTFGFCIQFFTTEPYACEASSLPKYPPSKELDVKLRDEEARRLAIIFSSFC